MYENNFLVARLRNASIGREGDVFVRGKSGRSFGQLFSNAEGYAATLLRLGLQPGDRVAVQVEKSIEAIELYLGTVMAGGVFLPLNPAYTSSEIAYFLTDATPHVFVVDPLSETQLTPVALGAGVKHVLTLGADGGGSLIRAKGEVAAVPRAADDLAAILYTSGTTGRSKGAMLSHKALASNAETLVDYWQFSERDTLIHALPIFHTHGLFVATNVALMAGASVIFQPKFDVTAILDAMPSATVLMGVPTFYTRLLAEPMLPEKAKNMRLFVSGSAPLLAETHDHWYDRTGHMILERYGMTETNMNTSNPYDGDRKAGTVGLPLPGVELRIVDAEDAVLPVGETGSIEVRGDNVFSGYWNMPEKTAEELRSDGWFITGDLGVQDTDGYISIVGRAKDLIITGGFNVYPKEVESVIDALDTVLESAVIGVPHPDFGESVVAIVVLSPSSKMTESEVIKATAAHLAAFKCPKQVHFVPELPRNTMGKVQKKALREEFANL